MRKLIMRAFIILVVFISLGLILISAIQATASMTPVCHKTKYSYTLMETGNDQSTPHIIPNFGK